MRIVCKEIIIVQREDISFVQLEQFYSQEVNKEKVILIYDGETYWTTVDYIKIRSICTQRDWDIFLNVDCCHECIHNENDDEWAEELQKHANVSLIPIMSGNHVQKFVQTAVMVREQIYIKDLYELELYLRKKHVQVYGIRMPDLDELTGNNHTFQYFAGDSMMWRDCNRQVVESIIELVTDKSYEEAKTAAFSASSLEGKILGSGKRKIFLVGGCVANGWAGFKGDELPVILNEKLEGQYEIRCILMGRYEKVKKFQILEYDIQNNDLVILLEYGWYPRKTIIDVASLFSQYTGDKWLYFNGPVHTTRYGNELLANAISEKIVHAQNEKKCSGENKVLHKGRPMFSYHDEKMIKMYCDGLPHVQGCDKIGAIVMNCNPFTLGHRYLVEQALQQVDVLYLFVVEEDESEFTFEERFAMVKEGTEDLKNIIVVPSGKFILSRESFRNYFEKDQLQGVVIDASKDLYIFAEYIAPTLGIQKRFVGEEPLDTVTRQYNCQMKDILGDAGIEVCEIQRRKIDNVIISASLIRKYLEVMEWESIQKFVPQTTMKYLHRHRKFDKKDQRKLDRYEQKMLQNMVDFMRGHERVVLYGTGRNARKLLRYLPSEVVSRLMYCDKRACVENYDFMGKKVMKPSWLSEQKDMRILVSSTEYKYDIYDALMKLGIAKECIMFHSLYFDEID